MHIPVFFYEQKMCVLSVIGVHYSSYLNAIWPFLAILLVVYEKMTSTECLWDIFFLFKVTSIELEFKMRMQFLFPNDE